MCPPRSDNGRPQCQHTLKDAVIDRARDVPGSVPAAPKPIHPSAETLVAEGIDQFGDGRPALLRQVQGEHITEFDPPEAASIHRRSVTRPSDVDSDCRCEAGKLGAATPRSAWGE
jgi:hypothetical protein